MTVKVSFIHPDGETIDIKTETGVSILQLAQENGIEMEGACEGNMACSTCHVIVNDAHFDKIPKASDEEEEMLDLASDLKMTSRLGCQVIITQDLDGIELILPKTTRNMMGF